LIFDDGKWRNPFGFEPQLGESGIQRRVHFGRFAKRSGNVIRPGGKVVTVATQGESTTDPRVRDAFFIVEANRAQLTEIARLFDTGALRAFVAGIFPFAQAREAYARAARGNQRGKIAVQIVPA
jgi:NADPH:quinone reductase-like Zn-dependent oxidoreductase